MLKVGISRVAVIIVLLLVSVNFYVYFPRESFLCVLRSILEGKTADRSLQSLHVEDKNES